MTIAEGGRQRGSIRAANSAAEVSALEGESNQLVYRLYGLTGEEIAIVEEKK